MTKKQVIKQPEKPIVGHTILMFKPLYIVIKNVANEKQCKMYEMVNKLLILGCQQWSAGQTNKKCKINVNSAELSKSLKMARQIR